MGQVLLFLGREKPNQQNRQLLLLQLQSPHLPLSGVQWKLLLPQFRLPLKSVNCASRAPGAKRQNQRHLESEC
jgi:hypothetical protein